MFVALAISLTFMALTFLRTLGDMGSAKFGGAVIQSVTSQPIIGTQLGYELIQFGLVLTGIHSLGAAASWILARITLSAWPGIRSSQRTVTVFWIVLAIIWVLAANAYWYPRSALGEPYSELIATQAGRMSLFEIGSLVSGSLIVVTLGKFCIDRRSAIVRSRLAWTGFTAMVAAGVAVPAIDGFGSAAGTGDERPHIVIIGIDSLRTDFVHNEEHQWTPALDRFLSESTQFSNAFTPLARTFPAWVSIVTGLHPHTTGAVVNLLPQSMIEIGNTLPSILSANGYQSVYAIDEVRFSNLDETYGFDTMLAPTMGSADFILGFFADTPVANILVNTPIGARLFPYGYANRAMEKTYEPDTFLDRIDSGVSFDRPTFLAAHLTLAHWPYTWASSLSPVDRESAAVTKVNNNRGRYEVAVNRVDQQFDDLMALLEKKRVLDNAVVIVLSDHGESLGESSPLTENSDGIELPLNTENLFGHGTHVFSKNQYNVVLGFRFYGSEERLGGNAERVSAAVTLEDLAPTIIDLLGIAAEQEFDGESLAPYLTASSAHPALQEPRIRFLETEFNPPGVSINGATSLSAMLSAAETYLIDPESDRVLIREEHIDAILAKRQYAAEFEGRILASVPAEGSKDQFLVYFDPVSRKAVWLNDTPTAIDDDVYVLWRALKQRFAKVRDRRVMAAIVPEIDASGSIAGIR